MSLLNSTFKYKTHSVLLALSVLFIPAAAFGQYESLCETIEQAISARFTNTQLHRNEMNSDGCNIDFTKPELSIDVEVYKTSRETRREFDKTARLFKHVRVNEPLKGFEYLATNGMWNKVILIPPKESGNSYVMVLRRDNYLITLLSKTREIVFDAEGLLRQNGLFEVVVDRSTL